MRALRSGRSLWESPGLWRLAPSEEGAEAAWGDLFEAMMDMLCYEEHIMRTDRFKAAKAEFMRGSWEWSATDSVKQFRQRFEAKLDAIDQAAVLDRVNIALNYPTDMDIVGTLELKTPKRLLNWVGIAVPARPAWLPQERCTCQRVPVAASSTSAARARHACVAGASNCKCVSCNSTTSAADSVIASTNLSACNVVVAPSTFRLAIVRIAVPPRVCRALAERSESIMAFQARV